MSEKNKIILQGIKFDEKSSFLRGPAKAPAIIRKALYSDSSNMAAEDGTIITNTLFIDKGDFEIGDYFEIETITKTNLDLGGKMLTLGGDHSITFPLIKAHQEVYPKLDILHIDAHSDLYDSFNGDKYSHACPFARIMEQNLAARLVQVGIRTLNTHQSEQAEKYGVEIHQMRNLDLTKIKSFKNPLYISLDMDAFDPAFAPGVSHIEPGGLSSRQVLGLIQNLDAEVVGADIVEYNPTRDFQEITAYLAAKSMKEMVSKMMHS
ncbi:agmatinase [Spongiimicrobium sp. 3-5]|uniref:agmatinase n=1 Tax=Spongiimicrobium sp. 3-5 TaxID=3332596 RepID=UPI00397F8A15